MATMLGEVYDALREIGVSEEKARKAAEAIASYDPQMAAIRSDVRMLTWMVGTNLMLTIGILVKLLHG